MMFNRSIRHLTLTLLFLFLMTLLPSAAIAGDDPLLPPELDNMLIIGGKGFTIDYIRDFRVQAGAGIGAALQVDPENLFLWMGGTLFNIRSQVYDAPVDITWVMENLEGYWDKDGEWIVWKSDPPDPECFWTGYWDAELCNMDGTLDNAFIIYMEQENTAVTIYWPEYPLNTGSGVIENNTLIGEWCQPVEDFTINFMITISEDCQSFTGTMKVTDAPLYPWVEGEECTYIGERLCQDGLKFTFERTAYIAYNDSIIDPDFDYNDFGMNMKLQEEYVNGVLESISMKFTARVNDAGHTHDIHIKRPLKGNYTYTIKRSRTATSREAAAVTNKSGSNDFDIVLFDTANFPGTVGQILNDWVEITITMADDSGQNLRVDYTGAPRWDLNNLLHLYNPYMYNRFTGYTIELDSMVPFNGFDVPLILVIPYTDWPAPAERVTITDDYPYFANYYKTRSPSYEEWYIPGFSP